MKTTLHFQVKDFKGFVLENLEKRGYMLASGTEPMMTGMDDTSDPEQVVMEVLVEDRPEIDFHQVVITSSEPAALPAPDPVVSPPKRNYKQDDNLTEEELAKQEAKRARWRRAAEAKRVIAGKGKGGGTAKTQPDHANALKIVAQANAPVEKREYSKRISPEERQQVVEQRLSQVDEPAVIPRFSADFQEKVLKSIGEIRGKKPEVVAPSPATFPSQESALTR